MILSLYFHNPTLKGFKRVVKILRLFGFSFISLEDLLLQVKSKSFVHSRQVFLSFDDGWNGNLRLLPLLERYRIPVTIFVSVNPVLNGNFWWEYVRCDMGHRQLQELKQGSYVELLKQVEESMSRHQLSRSAIDLAQLKQLSQSSMVTIGSHTMSHPLLNKIADGQLEQELADSKKVLHDVTGEDIRGFSYPNGNYTKREVDAVKRYYDCAFTTVADYISPGNSQYELPRICLTGNLVKDILKMCRIWPWIKKIASRF